MRPGYIRERNPGEKERTRSASEQFYSFDSDSPRPFPKIFPSRVIRERSPQPHSEANFVPLMRPGYIRERNPGEKERTRRASEQFYSLDSDSPRPFPKIVPSRVIRERSPQPHSEANFVPLMRPGYIRERNPGEKERTRRASEQFYSLDSDSPRPFPKFVPSSVTGEQSPHSEANLVPFIRPRDSRKRITEEKDRKRVASEQVLEQIGVKDCANCHTRVTPKWRRGPSGRRDLCNSCGLRWAASGDNFGKMDALKTMPKSESAISAELAPQLSQVEENFHRDPLDQYFGKPASGSAELVPQSSRIEEKFPRDRLNRHFRKPASGPAELAPQLSRVEDKFPRDPLDRYLGRPALGSKFRPERPLNTEYASKIAPNAGETSNNTWSEGSEDDAVEGIVTGKARRSRTASPYLDYETLKAFDRSVALEEDNAEEEARPKYKAEMEVKRAKEQLEKAEQETKKVALAKKAVEDWEREEAEKKEKRKQDKLTEEGLREHLRKMGLLPEQIAMMKGEKDDANKYENEMRLSRGRPTYIKVHKMHLFPETLEVYGLPWSYDTVGNFILSCRHRELTLHAG
jgi:GATA zinc finger